MSANGDGGMDQSCRRDGDKWLANKIYFVDRTYKAFMDWILNVRKR